MPFDSVVLAAVASEIEPITSGAQVVKIYQPDEEHLFIHLRAGGGRKILLLSVHPQRFRIHFVTETPENPASPPVFCMTLRKHLDGSKLVGVEQPGLERLLRLKFSRSDGERILVAELMGKHSNLVLLDEDEKILESIKHISRRVNRVREVLPNRPYIPPPPPRKLDPRYATLDQIREAMEPLGETVKPQGILKTLSNVGPLFAEEVVARAASPDPAHVAEALHEMMGRLNQRSFTPSLLLSETGHPVDAWAFEYSAVTSERQEVAPSMSVALEVSGHFGGQAEETERLREELIRRIASLREREERRLMEMREGLQRANKADDYRIIGELILANAHLLERGQTEAELANYYDPELKPLRVELSPTLSPRENADAYFQRQRKAKSNLPIVEERIAKTQGRLEELAVWASEVVTASGDRVRAMAAQLESETPERTGNTESPEVRRPGPGVRRTVSSDGYEIWYGEHQEGNDLLTSRLSSPNDLWLHVRAGASAHVVIRTGKKPDDVPQRTILEAARIAVAHSESKHAGTTPVDYTLKKYVRKPRGSGPGKASYTNERTLFVDSEESAGKASR